jgi:hypothetical protein
MGAWVWSAHALYRGNAMTAWERLYYGVIAVALICGVAVLGGCSTVKAIGDACLEDLCR